MGQFYFDTYNTGPSGQQSTNMQWWAVTNLGGDPHYSPQSLFDGGRLWSILYNFCAGIPWANPLFQGTINSGLATALTLTNNEAGAAAFVGGLASTAANLGSLVVTNNVGVAGTIHAAGFYGPGAGLTGLQSSNMVVNALWVTNAYTQTLNDSALFCWGTNQVITLLSSPPMGRMLTVLSENPRGSVIITNATGWQTITTPGVGRGLAVYLGAATSASNTWTGIFNGVSW